MRILYVHQYFGTPAGAVGTRSYEMARALVDAGHDVTMVCAAYDRSTTGLTNSFTNGRREGRVEGIRVIEFALGSSNNDPLLLRAWRFSAFAQRATAAALGESYDLLFATSTPLTAALPGIAAKLFRRKPFVFEVRDLWPELPRAMGMKNPLLLGSMMLLERLAYAMADQVIALAPGIRKGVARTGFPHDRITLIPNGCDLDLFAAALPVKPSDQFPELVGSNDFVAIFAGAHGKANGLAAVIAAGKVLQDRGRKDIKLLLVGTGVEKPQLKRDAEGLETIRFIEALPKHKVAAVIRGADAGLQILANVPAFYDGTSPNKFFDYLAAGRPVIINYPGWLAELVREQRCGWSVPPEDPEAFAEALIAAANDRAEAERRGAAALALGTQMFARSDLARKFVKTLEGVVPAIRRRRGTSAKRMLDIFVSMVALILLSPVLVALAVVVRRQMGAPVLFRQQRPGLNGRPFEMMKFRTMRADDPELGRRLSDAERLTPFGRWLRATSLDELPELWNVLKGEMSLVGPRPLLMDYLPLYSPEQMRRHEVRPGITGWAQVNGRNAIDWEQKFALDVWYVENRSFWLDVKIMFLTLARILRRDGINAQGSATYPVFSGRPNKDPTHG